MFQPLQKGGFCRFPSANRRRKRFNPEWSPCAFGLRRVAPAIADVTDVHDWTVQDAKKQLKELQELGQAITRLCLMIVAWKQFQGMCWPTRTVVT